MLAADEAKAPPGTTLCGTRGGKLLLVEAAGDISLVPFLVGDADRHWLAVSFTAACCCEDDGLLSLPVLIDARSLSALVGGDENEADDDEDELPASNGGAAALIWHKLVASRASINRQDRIIMFAYSE